MGVKTDDEKSKKPSVEQIDGFFMKMTLKSKGAWKRTEKIIARQKLKND